MQRLLDGAAGAPVSDRPSSFAAACRVAWRRGDYVGYDLALSGLRNAYVSLGRPQSARGHIEEERAKAMRSPDVTWRVVTGNVLGEFHLQTGDAKTALAIEQRSLEYARSAHSLFVRSELAEDLGNACLRLGRPQAAIHRFEEAIDLRRVLGDGMRIARCLDLIGRCWAAEGMPLRALTFYTQALKRERAFGDLRWQATTLLNIGEAQARLGRKRMAIESEQTAATILRQLNDERSLGGLLARIGFLYDDIGNEPEAIASYRQAVTVYRQIEDLPSEGAALDNLGRIYRSTGQPREARDVLEQALFICRQRGDRALEGYVVHHLGLVCSDLDEASEALKYLARALMIKRELRDRAGEGAVLNATGYLYWDLGEDQPALECFQRALPIERSAGDLEGEARTLSNEGSVWRDLGEPKKALASQQAALAIRRQIGDRREEGMSLVNIGLLSDDLGHPRKALEYYASAIPFARTVDDRAGEAEALAAAGFAYFKLGQPDSALAFEAKALPIFREVGQRSDEAATLHRIALLHSAAGRPTVASAHDKAALRIYGSLRQDLESRSPSEQRSFAESCAYAYATLATNLMRQDREEEAEQVIAVSKSDTLTNVVGTLPETPAESRWLQGLETRVAALAKLGSQIADLRDIALPTQAQVSATVKFRGAYDEAEAELLRYEDRIGEESVGIREADIRLSETEASRTLDKVLRALPGGSAVVYAVPDDSVIHLVCVRPGKTVIKHVSVKDLDATVDEFCSAVRDPSADPRPSGKRLYDALMKPIESDLDPHGVSMWCLTDSLRSIPIAALWDGERYTAEKFATASFNPAFIDGLTAPPRKAGTALVAGVTRTSNVADPVTGATVQFGALPGVFKEAAGVSDALGVTGLLDQAFTAKSLLRQITKAPSIIHLATHFRYYPGDDRRSFLVTGQDGSWTLDSVKGLPENALRGVDLVTLSACATGEGESATGDEAESFAAWLQRKGARSVISTLWPVEDDSTAIIMERFYRLLRSRSNVGKIDALRQAQLELLRGDLAGGGEAARKAVESRHSRPMPVRRRSELGKRPTAATKAPPWRTGLPRFSHPYYWAPFVLTGNWQ